MLARHRDVGNDHVRFKTSDLFQGWCSRAEGANFRAVPFKHCFEQFLSIQIVFNNKNSTVL
jgi:hypothetical protein